MADLNLKFSDLLALALGRLEEAQTVDTTASLGNFKGYSSPLLWQLERPDLGISNHRKSPYPRRPPSSARAERPAQPVEHNPEPQIRVTSLPPEILNAVNLLFKLSNRTLPKTLTHREFKKLYRALAQIHHPDKTNVTQGAPSLDNAKTFKRIAAAYQAAAPFFPKKKSV